MKHFLYLMLSLSAMTSCSSGNKQESLSASDTFPITIPFEEGVDNVKGIKLSDIAERVEWIPLETTDSSLIARPLLSSVRLMNGYIYIPCSVGLLSFREDGTFQRTISRRGQGPGEYTSLVSVTADEASNHIYLLTPGKVMTYTSEGTFLRENPTPIGWAFSVVQDSLYLTYIYNNTGQKPYRLLMTDAQGDTLLRVPQTDRFEVLPKGMNWYYTNRKENYLYTYQGENVFHDYYCDTLYTVRPDSLLPRYIFQMGKYRLPDDLRLEAVMMTSDRDQALARAENHLRPTLYETDRYVVMPYTTWNISDPEKADPQLMIYDKQTGLCTRAQGGTIQNDMTGNLPFYPAARIADNVLMASIEAEELLEKAKEGAELPESLKGLKEDDNPVLMLVYLKK